MTLYIFCDMTLILLIIPTRDREAYFGAGPAPLPTSILRRRRLCELRKYRTLSSRDIASLTHRQQHPRRYQSRYCLPPRYILR